MESDSESIRNLPKSLSFIESARRVFFKTMGSEYRLVGNNDISRRCETRTRHRELIVSKGHVTAMSTI